MLLQPRSFIYKKRQKQRKCLLFSHSNGLLNYGGAGLLLLNSIHLTANQLFRFKLFLKKASKKSDTTKRFVWFNAFPHLPLTRKANGTRMGKGKGKLECWFTNISGGSILIEFKNLRKGRAIFFVKQMTHKLGVPTKCLFSISYYLNNPISNTQRAPFKVYW